MAANTTSSVTQQQWEASLVAYLIQQGMSQTDAATAVQDYVDGKQTAAGTVTLIGQYVSANGAMPAGDIPGGTVKPIGDNPTGGGGSVVPTSTTPPPAAPNAPPTSPLGALPAVEKLEDVKELLGAGTTTPTTTPTSVTGPDGSTLTQQTASQIIDSALAAVGLDPNQIANSGADSGQTLAQFFWGQIVSQGITDETTIGEMISSLLPSTGQFQVAFPGYSQAVANGYVRTVAEYVSAEEGITAVMLQGGIPRSMINPTSVGNLIANGVSTNEVADRVNNGYDAVLNSPAEVQNYFSQEFGAQGSQALATVFLNPAIDDVTLKKMLAGTEVRGAFAAGNLTVSQGLSQRFADQGVTYQAAQQAAKTLNQERGLFEQTVGEQSSQTPVPGTLNQNRPLDINDQGVESMLGTNAADQQQVHQVALARQNEFRGDGGAASTSSEGYSGLSTSKPF